MWLYLDILHRIIDTVNYAFYNWQIRFNLINIYCIIVAIVLNKYLKANLTN